MNVQVKIGDQTFDVEIRDLSARPVLATIDGETFEVWPEEATPIPAAPAITQTKTTEPTAPRASIPAAKPSPANGSSGRVVQAPIPGVIVAIAVKPGDNVAKGQELCVLEAMKMKNSIRSPYDARVAAVLVNNGDHVQKGQPLIELAD